LALHRFISVGWQLENSRRAHLCGRSLRPARVALLPEFCFTNAHAANDSAVNLAATAAFYVWIRGLRHPEFDRRLFGAGAMLGLAFL